MIAPMGFNCAHKRSLANCHSWLPNRRSGRVAKCVFAPQRSFRTLCVLFSKNDMIDGCMDGWGGRRTGVAMTFPSFSSFAVDRQPLRWSLCCGELCSSHVSWAMRITNFAGNKWWFYLWERKKVMKNGDEKGDEIYALHLVFILFVEVGDKDEGKG